MPRKIIKANITHISFVPKAANGTDFALIKSNDGAKEMPIVKMDEEQRLVTGVVYAPDVEDAHGEYMEADAIEKAAHDFMINHRKTDINHNFQDNENVEVVESYVAKADFELNGQQIKKGTWLVTTFIKDDLIWKGIKSGELNGYSMGGSGVRELDVTKEEQGLTKWFTNLLQGIKKESEEETVTKSDIQAWVKEAMQGGVTKSDEAKPDDIVTKADIQAIVKEAMQPKSAEEEKPLTKSDLTEVITAVVKSVNTVDNNQTDSKDVEVDESMLALQKSVEQLQTQMQALAKSRGLSNQLSTHEPVAKGDNDLFNGLKF